MSGPNGKIDRILAQAIADHRAGNLQQAETGYRAVLATAPAHPVALCSLGMLAMQIGRGDAAVQLIERAIAVAPDYAEAHNSLGAVHASAGRNDQAEPCFRRAIAADPNGFEALRNLGTLLVATARAAEALPYFERAVAIQPLPPEIAINHAQALAAHDRLEEAETLLRACLAARPASPSPATNLGTILQAQGRLNEAIAMFEEAVRRAPNDGDTHYNLSIALLLAGRFADGWREHEWRRHKKQTGLATRRYPQPLWDGQPLNGTLFIYGEQGLGDIVQFVRFLPDAAARAGGGSFAQAGGVSFAPAGGVSFESPPRLHRLLRSMDNRAGIEFRGTPPATFDAHAGLMSLPHLFGIGLDAIAAAAHPYLAAEPVLIARWRQRLGPKNEFRIGIAWQGTPTFANDAQRSIPLRHFAALAAIPGVRLYSLQKGPGSEQLAAFGAPVVDLGPELDIADAFVDTAAVIASLDLVITSDTSLAHLAGALGAPVWTLLSFAPDWRWLTDRDDSPWYPTMRLFRQTMRGDWAGVFERVAAAVAKLERPNP